MAPAEGSNGTTGAPLSREQAYAADKAAFLAEMAGESVEETKQEAKPTKPAPKAASVEADADEAELEASSEDDDLDLDDPELDDEEEESPDEVEDKDDGTDPDKSKRLDAVRRREQRSREAIAKERRAFEHERDAFVKEWKPRIEAAEQFQAMKARGVNPYNAVDVLRELGLHDDDFEEAGRAVFAASKTGAADPKNKEAIARSKRERELADEIRELKKWRDDREANEKQTAEQAENSRQAERYLDGVVKAAPSGTLSAQLLEKDPKKARVMYAKIADRLWERTGERPAPKAIHAAYDKHRAKELRALGIDPATLTKSNGTKPTKPGDKKDAKKADEDRPLTRDEYLTMKFD